MKATALIPWILAGGLVASTFFNLHLMHRLDEVETTFELPRLNN